MDNDSHVYHHNVSDGPKLNVKVERNSRGVNYEITVIGVTDVDQAIELLKEAKEKLNRLFEENQDA